MKNNNLVELVKKFNHYINDHDIEGIVSLMTDEHTFIDTENTAFKGKHVMEKGWKDFFRRFPDYENHFEKFIVEGNLVKVIGHTTCAYEKLCGEYIWTAKIEQDLIAEWRVYCDTSENRKLLSIP